MFGKKTSDGFVAKKFGVGDKAKLPCPHCGELTNQRFKSQSGMTGLWKCDDCGITNRRRI